MSNSKYPLVDQAYEVINSDLPFAEKVKQVDALDKQTKGIEREIFGDVYSSLHLEANTTDDLALVGESNGG